MPSVNPISHSYLDLVGCGWWVQQQYFLICFYLIMMCMGVGVITGFGPFIFQKSLVKSSNTLKKYNFKIQPRPKPPPTFNFHVLQLIHTAHATHSTPTPNHPHFCHRHRLKAHKLQ
jgi:hypothetical protein